MGKKKISTAKLKKAKLYNNITKIVRFLFVIIDIILLFFIFKQLYFSGLNFREASHHPIGPDDVTYEMYNIPAQEYDFVGTRQIDGNYEVQLGSYKILLTEPEFNALCEGTTNNKVKTEIYTLKYKCKNPIVFQTVQYVNIGKVGQPSFDGIDLTPYNDFAYIKFTNILYSALFYSEEAQIYYAEPPNNYDR